MLKKIVLFALALIPVALFAQESQKIAYFNSEEVIVAMPEYKYMTDSLQKQAETFESELKIMYETYEKKSVEFYEQQAELIEAIKVRRLQEIEDLKDKISNFQQQAQLLQDQLRQALFAPIQEKLQKALTEIGTENHFAYILDARVLLFTSPQSVNATPLVKQKLGLK